jgi:hypothetical protein
MTKIALPLLVGILVVDTVLYVVREEVLKFDRRAKPKAYLGRLSPGHRSGPSVTARTEVEGEGVLTVG